MNPTYILYILGAIVLLVVLRKAQIRLELSRAKHRSLAGHSRWSRRFAALVPFYEYDEAQFFGVDSAPPEVATSRRAGFMRLAALFAQRYPKTAALTADIQSGVSDMQFTSRYRVPFQFSAIVAKHFKLGSVLRVLVRHRPSPTSTATNCTT